jgi:hypothetical protein
MNLPTEIQWEILDKLRPSDLFRYRQTSKYQVDTYLTYLVEHPQVVKSVDKMVIVLMAIVQFRLYDKLAPISEYFSNHYPNVYIQAFNTFIGAF